MLLASQRFLREQGVSFLLEPAVLGNLGFKFGVRRLGGFLANDSLLGINLVLKVDQSVVVVLLAPFKDAFGLRNRIVSDHPEPLHDFVVNLRVPAFARRRLRSSDSKLRNRLPGDDVLNLDDLLQLPPDIANLQNDLILRHRAILANASHYPFRLARVDVGNDLAKRSVNLVEHRAPLGNALADVLLHQLSNLVVDQTTLALLHLRGDLVDDPSLFLGFDVLLGNLATNLLACVSGGLFCDEFVGEFLAGLPNLFQVRLNPFAGILDHLRRPLREIQSDVPDVGSSNLGEVDIDRWIEIGRHPANAGSESFPGFLGAPVEFFDDLLGDPNDARFNGWRFLGFEFRQHAGSFALGNPALGILGLVDGVLRRLLVLVNQAQ